MITLVKTLAFAAGTMLATSAFAQSAREVRGPSPNVAVEHEGRLPPLSDAVGWLNSAPLALAELRGKAGLSHLKIYELSEDLRKEGIVPSGLLELSAQGGF
jgi:hypothetical protein